MPKIIISIENGGEITSEVDGVVGKDCEALDKFLLSSGKVIENKKKKEYYQKDKKGVSKHVSESV